MSSVDEYILGNNALYGRLCLITELLGKFVACAPRGLDIGQLKQHTGRPARELEKLCARLQSEGLLQPQPGRPLGWRLACEASEVTLEDAFRCAVAEQAARARPKSAAAPDQHEADRSRREVDLLLMQATMSINQSIFQHLRQFSLDRLKVSAAGMFPARRDSAEVWPYPRLSYS